MWEGGGEGEDLSEPLRIEGTVYGWAVGGEKVYSKPSNIWRRSNF